MRPIAHFTLHAALATALIAFAATGAAAAAADGQSSTWIRVSQLSTGGGMAQSAPAAAPVKWIEIQGWDWETEGTGAQANKISVVTVPPIIPAPGPAVDKWKPAKPHAQEGAAKVEGFTVKQGVKPVQPKPRFVTFFDPSNPSASVKPVGTSDLTMKRGTSPATTAPSATSPGARRFDAPMDYDTGDTGTHEARGASRPLAAGGSRTRGPAHSDKFGRVRVKFAWDACAAGQRLGSVELRDARTHYVLENVTVVRCAPGGTTLAYAGLRQSPVR